VILGATGDLVIKKIFPILKNVGVDVITYSRKEPVSSYPTIIGDLANLAPLQDYLATKNYKNVYAYFSLPPNLYYDLIVKFFDSFEKYNLHIALEKPFGEDFDKAQKLASLVRDIGEDKFYIVDHYITKEPLMQISEAVNKNAISKIETAILESDDIKNRGNFYDQVGAIKDTGQNHLLVTVMCALGRGLTEKDLVYKRNSLEIGQFEGYKKIEGVNKNSKTETYFKAGFKCEDIEITLKSGKALKEDASYLKISYRDGKEILIDLKNYKAIKSPHEYIINDFISDTFTYAVSVDTALTLWKIINPLLVEKGEIKLTYYSKYSF
jgi:glucose-6-phosphate 1-dehydrogenase